MLIDVDVAKRYVMKLITLHEYNKLSLLYRLKNQDVAVTESTKNYYCLCFNKDGTAIRWNQLMFISLRVSTDIARSLIVVQISNCKFVCFM